MAVTTPQLPHHRRREEEQQWLEEGKFLVTFFGMLGYEILAVCDTEEEANEVCALWKIASTLATLSHPMRRWRERGLHLKGWTRCVSPHDIDVRTQADLDHLTDAILSSYR